MKYRNYCLRCIIILACLTVAVIIISISCTNKVDGIIETARRVATSDMARMFGDMYTVPRITALQKQLNAWWPAYYIFYLLKSYFPIVASCICVLIIIFWKRINRALNIRSGAIYVETEEMVGIVKKCFKIGKEYAIKLLLVEEGKTIILSDKDLYEAVNEEDVVTASCDVHRLTVNDELKNIDIFSVTVNSFLLFIPKSLGSV